MNPRTTIGHPLLLTDTQVALEVGMPKKRVQLLARLRVLPGFKVGRSWRFDPDAIRRWIGEMNSPKSAVNAAAYRG